MTLASSVKGVKRAAAFNHLSDPYPGDPEVHGQGVVAAQVFDVLRLLLDLRMLKKQIRWSQKQATPTAAGLLPSAGAAVPLSAARVQQRGSVQTHDVFV